MEKMVEPNVNATAFSVSPSYLSEKVEARPAVGIANAMKNPISISASTAYISFTKKSMATPKAGIHINFTAETK